MNKREMENFRARTRARALNINEQPSIDPRCYCGHTRGNHNAGGMCPLSAVAYSYARYPNDDYCNCNGFIAEQPSTEQPASRAGSERDYYGEYQRSRAAKYPAKALAELLAAGEINHEQYERLRRESVERELPTSAAQAKGERWHVSKVKNDVRVSGLKVNATEIYVEDGRADWCAQVLRPERAEQIVNTMNQHSTLIEQRDQLVKALRDLLECSRCKNGCAPDDMTCATSQADAVLATIEQEGEMQR